MKRYKVNSAEWYAVSAVECDPVGYPHTDADGEVQYVNTHFDTEAAALDCALRNLDAAVRMLTRDVRATEARLAQSRSDVADAAIHLTERRKQYEALSRRPIPEGDRNE